MAAAADAKRREEEAASIPPGMRLVRQPRHRNSRWQRCCLAESTKLSFTSKRLFHLPLWLCFTRLHRLSLMLNLTHAALSFPARRLLRVGSSQYSPLGSRGRAPADAEAPGAVQGGRRATAKPALPHLHNAARQEGEVGPISACPPSVQLICFWRM